MIEITTSALMLFSALYGSPQAIENSATITLIKQEITNSNLERYTREYFKDIPILAEIAKCESRFTQFDKNGKVIRGKVNRSDVGVMQINEYYHLDQSQKLDLNIHSVDGNLEYAKLIYDKSGTSPWNSSQKCWGKYSKDLAKK
ncbi:MAG: hypothetical protein NUV47_00120 [Patescibacteria group bacterium]|nr:hypothetical protein [Patescibacteria group bacterium]